MYVGVVVVVFLCIYVGIVFMWVSYLCEYRIYVGIVFMWVSYLCGYVLQTM